MTLGEVQVNQDLMAIIGGTIPLGAVMFALIRWVDGRFRKDMAALRDEMRAGDGRLRDEQKASEGRFREELQASEGRLREELQASRGRLEDGIREITERLVNVGDRLSKVEASSKECSGARATSRPRRRESERGRRSRQGR